MILELVVSTTDADGSPRFSPMGVIVPDDFCWTKKKQIVELRPFSPSRTLDNLRRNPVASLQMVADTAVFAGCLLKYHSQAEIEKEYRNLKTCLTWTERSSGIFVLDSATVGTQVHVLSFQEGDPQVSVTCRTKDHFLGKPFVGWNRAKHAIIELVILGTRTDRIPKRTIQQRMEDLVPVIQRTGSSEDQKVLDFLLTWFGALV